MEDKPGKQTTLILAKECAEMHMKELTIAARARLYFDAHMDYLVRYYDPAKHKDSISMQHRLVEAAAIDHIDPKTFYQKEDGEWEANQCQAVTVLNIICGHCARC